jgi:hypothetical protein
VSPHRDKTVAHFVEKYRQKYPELDRDLLRKLIRLENNITNPSELRKLDRELKKAFSQPKAKENETMQQLDAKKKSGVIEWWSQRAERKRFERNKERRFALAQKWTYLELLAELHPEFEAAKKWADIEKKNLKELSE